MLRLETSERLVGAEAQPDADLNAGERRLGRYTLRPHRELLHQGVCVPIGSKALALVSVLAEADGELVTKDELVAAAWRGAVVDDNVLQVHIAAVRKVLGEDADLLTTVRGQGYRLKVAPLASVAPLPKPQAPDELAQQAPPRERAAPGRWLVVAVFGLVLCAGAAIWLIHTLWPSGRLSEGLTELTPFQPQAPGGELRTLSGRLGETISNALSSDHLEVAMAPASRSGVGSQGQAEFRVAGAVWQEGDAFHVHAHLDDVRNNVVLWSDDFNGPVAQPASLEANVAARTADAARWARIGRAGAVKLDPVALAAFIIGHEGRTEVRDEYAMFQNYQKVVASAPNFSWGHSAMAVYQGFDLVGQPPTPRTQAEDITAQAEANRALQLDAHNGEAYLALELLTPRTEWSRREKLLLKGAAADPDFDADPLMEGRLLWAAGRAEEASDWFHMSHDIDPFHNGANWSLVLNLASEGWTTQSRALLEQMIRQWPAHPATQDARFWVSYETGDLVAALASLKDPATWPSEVDEKSVALWRTALAAMQNGAPDVRSVAAKQTSEAAAGGLLDHGAAAALLVRLGDLDDAFSQARLYRVQNPYSPPYLFLSSTAPLREDRRFMAVAQDLGLIAFWRASGRWPDFCRDPHLTYNCHAEAQNYPARAIQPSY